MAKVSPVSIKYMIHATFIAEGALENFWHVASLGAQGFTRSVGRLKEGRGAGATK